jgi:Co/Zn/Cd efflux system component
MLEFYIPARRMTVYHNSDIVPIAALLGELDLGTRMVETTESGEPEKTGGERQERKMLLAVLMINAAFFILEMLAGLLSGSMGLVADSLDMLADAGVYGMSLMVVGAHLSRKKNVALASGYLQLGLALLGLAEVIRRFLGFDAPPDAATMMVVSLMALAGNAACLLILQRLKSTEAHIRASVIFTSNDVIINLGVIVAGALVLLSGSNKPDLVIGAIVFVIVIRGAFRILKLAR